MPHNVPGGSDVVISHTPLGYDPLSSYFCIDDVSR